MAEDSLLQNRPS